MVYPARPRVRFLLHPKGWSARGRVIHGPPATKLDDTNQKMRMRIVAGTYEGFCYGWESHPEAASDKSADAGAAAVGSATKSMQGLKPAQPSSTTATAAAAPQPLSLVFGYNVHVGCMKSVAMATSGTRAGQLLVTGGADERVRIYDLRDRTELGELQQHNGGYQSPTQQQHGYADTRSVVT